MQLLERVERAHFGRVVVEDFAIGADRRRRIDEQLLLDEPDAEEQVLLLRRRRRPLGLAMQDVDERAPILGRLVQPRQRRRRRPRRVQVRRIEVEQPPPRRARPIDVLEIVFVQLGRFLQQLAAQLEIVGIGRQERLFPRRRQLRLPAEQERQSLDVVARALVGRVEPQRLAPRRQRQLPRAQLLLLQLGQLRQERRRVAPFGGFALRAEHQRQLRPRFVGAIERLERLGDALAQLGPLHERLEPFARAFVTRLHAERVLEQIGGAHRVVEPVGVQFGAAERQMRARLGQARLFRRERNAPLQEIVERPPILGRRVQPLERAERSLRRRIQLQHFDVIARRRRLIVEHAFVEIADLIEQRQAPFTVERALLLAFEQPAQILPALVDAVELHERDLRVFVGRVALEHALVGRFGVGGHAEARVEQLTEIPRQIPGQPDFAALGRRVLHGAELHRPVVGLVELVGELRHHAAIVGVAGRAREHLAAVAVGARRVAELGRRQIHQAPQEHELGGRILFVRAHDLQRVDELGRRLGFTDGQSRLVHRREQARHAHAIGDRGRAIGRRTGREPTLERAHRRLVRARRRRHVESRAEMLERLMRIVEVGLVDLAQPMRQLEARVVIVVRRQRQLLRQRLGHAARVAAAGVELLERAQRPHLRRRRLIAAQDALIRADRRRRIAELLLFDPRDLEQHLETPLRIGGARFALLVDRQQLLVIAGLREDLLEVAERLGVFGRALQHLFEVFARLVGLVEPRERDARQLAEALGLARLVRLFGDLRLIDLGQLFPGFGFGGEPLEIALQPGVARQQLIGLGRPGERQRLRAQLLLA